MLLRQMLYRCNTRFLPIIAEHWLKLRTKPNYEELIRLLCPAMLDEARLRRLCEKLPSESVDAIRWLLGHENREKTAVFEARFGVLRVTGINQVLREKYWLHTVSATEDLWYRGLIYRTTRAEADGLTEYFEMPDDLAKAFAVFLSADSSAEQAPAPELIVRPAVPAETASAVPADESLPDLLTLAAAFKRDGRAAAYPGTDVPVAELRFMDALMTDCGMFDEAGNADAEAIRLFLVENRTAARLRLLHAWRTSERYEELAEDPARLTIVTAPRYSFAKVRNAALKLIETLAPDTWWSLNGFIAAVKKADSQFLRGCFAEDLWTVLDADGNDLHGMSSWFQFEGVYLSFLIFGPLYWLGITQPAWSDSEKTKPAAFRVSREGLFFLTESAADEVSAEIKEKPNLEQQRPTIGTDGLITCTDKVPRYFRYMAARCCELEKRKADVSTFRVTPQSLASAEHAGITRGAFLNLLRRFSNESVPPTLRNLLEDDAKRAIPAAIYSATLLTVPGAEIMERLLDEPKLEKWILQQVNPTSVIIDKKGIEPIRRYLMENEIFVDVQN